MGFDKVIYFYTKVCNIIFELYKAYSGNFSIWTIGWRLFEGTGSPVLAGLEAPPLIAAPAMASYVSIALAITLLGGGLILAHRSKSFDNSFGILVCVSILVNPIAWSHYLILAIITFAIVGRRLYDLGLPEKETWMFIVIGFLLFIPRLDPRWFMLGYDPIGKSCQIPFLPSLLTLIPTVAIFCLVWLLCHIEHVYYE